MSHLTSVIRSKYSRLIPWMPSSWDRPGVTQIKKNVWFLLSRNFTSGRKTEGWARNYKHGDREVWVPLCAGQWQCSTVDFKQDVSLINWGRQSDFISQKLSIINSNPKSFPQLQESLTSTIELAEGKENNYFKWIRTNLKIHISLLRQVQRPTPKD